MSFNKKEIDFIIKSKKDGKSFRRITYDFNEKFGKKVSKSYIYREYKKQVGDNKEKVEDIKVNNMKELKKNITIPYRKDGKLQYTLLSLDDIERIHYSYVRDGSGLSLKDISEINFGNGKFPRFLPIELVREVIRKFNINKKDTIVSEDFFAEKLMQLDEKEQELAIEEIKKKSDNTKYKDTMLKKYLKVIENKNKEEYIHNNTMEYFFKKIEDIGKNIKGISNSKLKLKPITFKKEKEKRILLFISDLHIGRTTGMVKKYLEYILEYIKKGGYNVVDIYNLGDNFENLSGLQMHSNQNIEQDFFGITQIQIAAYLLSHLLLEIRKYGAKVSMNIISGNHDRFTQNFKEDTKQTGGAILGYIMKIYTSNIDGISICYKNDQDFSRIKEIYGQKNFSNKNSKNVNELVLDSGKFLYKYYEKNKMLVVCHHGDAGFNKFSTEQISGKVNDYIISTLKKDVNYKVIVSGHNHDHFFQEVGKTIRIRCGSLNGPNGYVIDSPYSIAGPSCFAMQINPYGYPEMLTLHMPDITVDEIEKETEEIRKICIKEFSGNSADIIID